MIRQKIQSLLRGGAEPASLTRCSYCGLASVCVGADLAYTRFRCPRHCREYEQFGGFHGDSEYMNGHEHAEGVTI